MSEVVLARGQSPGTSRARRGGSARGQSPGFTLIEVLAALVIVALGMLAAISAVNQSVRNGTYLREKTLAHWIAMNVITERRLQTSPPDVAESTGQVEYAGERWQWTMKVTQTQVESMRRMDVAVRRAEAPETSVLASASGFYGTAIGAAGGQELSWYGSGNDADGGDDEEEAGQDDDTPVSPTRPNRPNRPNRDPHEDPEPLE